MEILNQLNMAAIKPKANSRTEIVLENIKQDILDCKLLPGSKLLISELKDRYFSGGSPIREALSGLVSQGLVEKESQKGFKVASLSLDDFKDVAETRIRIELMALEMALKKGDDLWESTIVGSYYRLTKMETLKTEYSFEEWEERNRDFHKIVISACGSNCLLSLQQTLYEQTVRYRKLWLHITQEADNTTFKRNNSEHKAIMDYAIARDIKNCRDILREHLYKAVRKIDEAIDKQIIS